MNLAQLSQSARDELSREVNIQLSRRLFWSYCLYTDSETYKEPHLQTLCTLLNNLYYGLPLDSTGKIYRNLILSLPPRHWKTRTLIHFCAWSLGKNNQNRIIAGTYNETEASDYGKYTRDEIEREKNLEEEIVFSDVFPETKLKHGDRAKGKWALEGEHFNFLSTSPHGSLTGKGGTIKILDDLVKDAEKAMNEAHLDDLFTWYVSTYASRTEALDGGVPIEVVCATRWSKNDVTGRLLQDEPGEWFVYEMEAFDGEKMLCDAMLSYEAYERIRNLAERNTNPVSRALFQANYHQKIVAIEGALYTNMQTYEKLPEDISGQQIYEARKAYFDTADQGDDYLCGIYYIVHDGLAYVVDVEYSQANAEITEPEVAQKIIDNDIREADFESNAGGRGYARNIERLLTDAGYSCSIVDFHQSKNKDARIQSQSNNVLEKVRVPVNWIHRWPEFANHLLNFNVKIKNQPDDCADAITGVYERMSMRTMWG